jgi:hypothetical protein
MNNLETQAALSTRHRATTNKNKTLKDDGQQKAGGTQVLVQADYRNDMFTTAFKCILYFIN